MNQPDPNLPPELQGLDPGELFARGLNTVRPSGGMHNWTPPTPEELARLLPQYHIECLIGHGGMGAVYKGFQDKLARTVAIKLLPAELTADSQFVTRFEREARTLAKLQHPGIVSIYDFGHTTDGHLYFVMEFVEGTDLRRILQGPGLNPEQALEIIVQVCEALHAAHRQGVIHRDIKPANILITSDGRVKLADFGLARPDQDEHEGLTLSNVVLGTPDYMAPEQHKGLPDHRADIFALGLMLYEMLTGQLPRGAWVPPSRKVSVDVRIDEVVIKALQEEPEMRYQQASEMKTDVDHIRSGVAEAVPDEPPALLPVPKEKQSIMLLAAMISAGVVLVGMAVFLLFGMRAPSDPVTGEAPVAKIKESAPIVAASTAQKPPEPAAESSPSPAILPASPQGPTTLEEAMFNYDWQYKTIRDATATRESYSFVHRLFFQKDGTAYSMGRKQTWKWSWTRTGPLTVHIDQQFQGHTTDIAFDASFKKFEGKSTEGSTLAGYRQKLFTDQDLLAIQQELQGVFQQPASARKGSAEEVDTDGKSGEGAMPPSQPTPGQSEVKQSTPPLTPVPASVSDSGNLSPETIRSPRNASEALMASSWYFTNAFDDSDANKSVYVFKPDGTIKNADGTATGRTWEAKGVQAFALFSDKGSTILTFNETFTRFEGSTIRGNGTAVGTRIEATLGNATEKPSSNAELQLASPRGPVDTKPPTPSPAPVSGIGSVPVETVPSPRNAAEAVIAFHWKFESPGNNGELTFLADGSINKSWKQAFPWRWEPVSEHEFMMREMGGKRHITTLTFDNNFTSFEGPGFTNGQIYRGSRVVPPSGQMPVATAPPPPPPAAPAPAKSNLDILAENGPVITDQVLSPLDAPSIPEATVSVWMEDLLDEAARSPDSQQQVFRNATALLAAWKSALRERNLIADKTKFSGSVMETTDMQSSRKTVLHVWDWLQYSRERDDAAKHEKTLERKADFFAAGPPKRWADRCTVLRANIDRLYGIFRKSRREMPAATPTIKQP